MEIIDKENLNLGNSFLPDQIQPLLGDLLVTLHQDLAGLRIQNIMSGDSPDDIFPYDRKLLDPGLFHLANQGSGDLFSPSYD